MREGSDAEIEMAPLIVSKIVTVLSKGVHANHARASELLREIQDERALTSEGGASIAELPLKRRKASLWSCSRH